MERWGKSEGKRLVIYLIFMFKNSPLCVMYKKRNVSDRGVWKKKEIPVVFGEGGSHVLHFTSKPSVSFSVSQQVVCQNMPFHVSKFHRKITLCLHMSENVAFF